MKLLRAIRPLTAALFVFSSATAASGQSPATARQCEVELAIASAQRCRVQSAPAACSACACTAGGACATGMANCGCPRTQAAAASQAPVQVCANGTCSLVYPQAAVPQSAGHVVWATYANGTQGWETLPGTAATATVTYSVPQQAASPVYYAPSYGMAAGVSACAGGNCPTARRGR